MTPKEDTIQQTDTDPITIALRTFVSDVLGLPDTPALFLITPLEGDTMLLASGRNQDETDRLKDWVFRDHGPLGQAVNDILGRRT